MSVLIAVIDLDTGHMFECDTEAAAKDFEAAILLMGHEVKVLRSKAA